ncbi:MAG: Ig-like domain repeat protein, partial [Thaumarchaeota archaeon]|nr:Ig-like domain repeat protein [Nitrososphaerota archaeon]
YYICDGSTPIGFYQIWNLVQNTIVGAGTTSVSTGAHTFSMYVTSGMTWAFALDGTVFGTFNMGSTTTVPFYPVYALSEESSVSSPQAISQVEFYTALSVLRSGSWQPVTSATSYGSSWGMGGIVQDLLLPADALIVGGGMSVLSQGTSLWDGIQQIIAHSTSTSVTCSPSSPQVGSSTSCTAKVTDTSSLLPLTPSGTVSFAHTGSGTFSPSSCTLAGSGSSSSCAATYSPVGAGTATITATYGGDLLHSGSSGTSTLQGAARSTSTSVTCSPTSPQAGSSTSCTAKVTDTASGTLVTPSGTVSFASTGSGTFSSAKCTLASSTCAVTYSPSAAGTATITASYSGDSVHSVSSGASTLTVSNNPTQVTSPLAIDGSWACSNGNANSCKVAATTAHPSDIIIVAEATQAGHFASAPSDTAGLNWISLKDYSDGKIDLHIYYAKAVSELSSDTITCNFTPNARSSCVALGISGASQTTVFDQNSVLPCSAKGTSTTSSCSITTTNADDIVVGFVAAGCGIPVTHGSGFTIAHTETFCGPSVGAEYKIVSSTQSNQPISFALGSSSQEWVTIGDAIMQGT